MRKQAIVARPRAGPLPTCVKCWCVPASLSTWIEGGRIMSPFLPTRREVLTRLGAGFGGLARPP